MTYRGATQRERLVNIPKEDWRRAISFLCAVRRSGGTLAPWSLALEVFDDVTDDSKAKARDLLALMESAKMVAPAPHQHYTYT